MMKLQRRQFNRLLLSSGLMSSGLLTACASNPSGRSDTAGNTLRFDPERYTKLPLTVAGRTFNVRAHENLPVVTQPVLASHQAINVYVPEAYFLGQAVGRYTAKTAPIFLPNQIGGYMPALPGKPTQRMGPPLPPGTVAPPTAMAVALSRGYVVASPGARGRTQQAADGRWIGKAPAAIVDLKAAVRWLHHNAGRLPGNTERIVSNGTSAGGALSALLGASGNHPDYAAELQALGAAPGRDDVFAVSAYCPITNLEHADAAYEWQFQGLAEYRSVKLSMLDFSVQRQETVSRLSADQLQLSAALRADFVSYVNGLQLKAPDGQPLQLASDGRGALRDHVAALVVASAQRALDSGKNLSDVAWLTLQGQRLVGIDFDAYVRAIGRMKGLPAFDGLALETGENQLFGNAGTDTRHFTAFSMQHGSASAATRADERSVRLMNAMHMAGDPRGTVSRHWRIRHGTNDRDTSLAVPVLLAAALRQRGLDVDLALPWGQGHGGDYDLDELFAWVDRQVLA
jgi:hypothetical protein